MKRKESEKRTIEKRHVVLGAAACAALLAVAVPLVLYGPDLFAFFADGERLRAWVDAQGAFAPLAMVALIVVQIVAAVLPGEPLELGAGYIFGFWEGTALCMAAGLVGTFIVVTLVRTLGMKAVELFFSREKIESMKWLQDSARFELLMFVCFLIPGTPKDAMTYVAGLTRCPVWRIALITTVGRIPSIVSSTMAAGFAASGDWAASAVVVVLTAGFAAVGVGLYAAIAHRERKREQAARMGVVAGASAQETSKPEERLAA